MGEAAAAKTQSFEADVSRLLHLMVHSVYSERDIFVRELVSNAADACEKLRYESIAKPELIEDGAPFAIEITINPDAKTLTFSDNGVGMTREDLTQGLGRPVERRLYGVSSPPVICRDVIVMGCKVNDVPLAGRMPPGDVRGFDVRTGKRLWIFHTGRLMPTRSRASRQAITC